MVFPFYHAVSNNTLVHMKHLYPVKSVEHFTRDLDFLLEHFNPLKMSEFLSGRFLEDPEKPPMVLSFDDGLIQCYEEVMPILLSRSVPATFFLNNAFIDNRGMFFRYKVSILVEMLPEVSIERLQKAAKLLHCEPDMVRNRLLTVNYVEREITDQVAKAWGYDFQDYLRESPVYLSSMQIRRMIGEGFEFGSHGIDHPMFSLLKRKTTIDHISASVEDLCKRYDLSYRFFAFPFTDHGVEDETIDHLLKRKVIDAGFGTAGMKEDLWENYFQRIPMEVKELDARAVIGGEINRHRVRGLLGRNKTER